MTTTTSEPFERRNKNLLFFLFMILLIGSVILVNIYYWNKSQDDARQAIREGGERNYKAILNQTHIILASENNNHDMFKKILNMMTSYHNLTSTSTTKH